MISNPLTNTKQESAPPGNNSSIIPMPLLRISTTGTNPFPIGNYSNEYDKLIPAKRTIIRLTYVECKLSNC